MGEVVFRIPNSYPLSSLISTAPNESEVGENSHELEGSSAIQALPQVSHDFSVSRLGTPSCLYSVARNKPVFIQDLRRILLYSPDRSYIMKCDAEYK